MITTPATRQTPPRTRSTIPEPKPGIFDIAPYVPGGKPGGNGAPVHVLASNETPFGPSPGAVAALAGLTTGLAVYPDGSARRLRRAIAGAHNLDPDRIVCGNGSDELISLLCQAYLGPGDEGVFTEHGFLVYRIQIMAAGARPVSVPETGHRADVDALLAAVTPRTRVVFLANPNNPTGTWLPAHEVRRLRDGLPGNVLLVLDAAYAEYVRHRDYEAGAEQVTASENVVMTRTFSKIHGLAALRIGWAFGPPTVVDALNRVRGPFNVNAAAIAAGAAAVADRDHVERAVAHNSVWLTRLTQGFTALGLAVTPSAGNFVLIHFDGAGRTAKQADAFLKRRGFVLRRVGAYGLPNALRMTVGAADANEGALAAMAEFLGSA